MTFRFAEMSVEEREEEANEKLIRDGVSQGGIFKLSFLSFFFLSRIQRKLIKQKARQAN